MGCRALFILLLVLKLLRIVLPASLGTSYVSDRDISIVKETKHHIRTDLYYLTLIPFPFLCMRFYSKHHNLCKFNLLKLPLTSLTQAPKQWNCISFHSNNLYNLRSPGVNDSAYSSTSVTFIVDSEQEFTVSVRSRNSKGMQSPWERMTVTAPLLRK